MRRFRQCSPASRRVVSSLGGSIGGGEAVTPCGRKLKIQNSKFKIKEGFQAACTYNRFGLQPAEHAGSATNCGPSPGGGCGPLGPDGPEQQQRRGPLDLLRGRFGLRQARSRAVGLRREGAALRQGAAAGCGGFFSKPQIQHSKLAIGQQLAKDTQKRTFGTRIAGLRRAKLRPARS